MTASDASFPEVRCEGGESRWIREKGKSRGNGAARKEGRG